MLENFIINVFVDIFARGAVAVAVAGGAYDGTWHYDLSTTSSVPTCRGFAAGNIEIKDNKFSGHIAHDQDSFRLRGEVDDTGVADFRAIGTYDTVQFKVTFSDNGAAGTWQSKTAGCDGSIELSRPQ